MVILARKDGSTLEEPQKGSPRVARPDRRDPEPIEGGDDFDPVADSARREEERFERKSQGAVVGSTRPEVDASWACVGCDTSMTAIAAVAVGYDAKLGKRVGPFHGEIRWYPDDDYFKRLGEAARGHDLILDLLKKLWVVDPSRVFVAFEEPIHYGAMQRQVASFAKQQAEVSGAFKGSLVRYGFVNLIEITNSQWYAVLRRDGVQFIPPIKDGTSGEKSERSLANKMMVKRWGIEAFGLPDLPDLVRSKSGAKIPRPESGYGSTAKPIQPNDVFDSAGVLAWLLDDLETREVIE